MHDLPVRSAFRRAESGNTGGEGFVHCAYPPTCKNEICSRAGLSPVVLGRNPHFLSNRFSCDCIRPHGQKIGARIWAVVTRAHDGPAGSCRYVHWPKSVITPLSPLSSCALCFMYILPGKVRLGLDGRACLIAFRNEQLRDVADLPDC